MQNEEQISETNVVPAETPLGADLGAGLVVCLVALPLCLGIALASGAPLVSGLVTGVVGGVLVSLVGRTPLLVSGPAAGLAAIVLAAITELGSFPAFLAAVVVSGLLQLGFAAARSGRLASLVPSSVVTGMLAAIGVLLLLQQLPRALGVTPEKAKGFALFLLPFKAVPLAVLAPTVAAAITLAVVVGWEKLPFAKVKKVLPGPLVAVLLGTLAGELLGVEAALRVDLPDLSGGLGALFTLPDFGALTQGATWKVAVTLAVVASLESLLSLEATDRLDPLKRKSNGDRELAAQGLGNMVSGLLGGIPMTGVIVRSAANVSAGGRTWRASFTHGLLLAVAVVALPMVLERIPLSVLAAILLHTGWKLAHPSRFVAAHGIGMGQLLPLVATVVGVVATDLLVGVAIGLLTSAVVTLVQNARHGVKVTQESTDGQHHVAVELSEAVSFVHKSKIQDALHGAPAGARVVVDGSRTRAFDHDVVELLHSFTDTARERGIHYRLVAVPVPVSTTGH